MFKGKVHIVRTFVASMALAAFIYLADGDAIADTCSEVTLNGSGVWHPVSKRTADGTELTGVFPDVARSVFRDLSIAINFGPDVPWKRAFALLDNGSVDVLTGAYKTRDRFENYGASLPVMQEEVAVFVRPDLKTEPQSLKDLIGMRGLAPFGANFGEELDEYAAQNLTIERQPFEEFATNMRLLNDGKVDYLIIARQEGERLVKYLDVEDRVKALPWPAAVNSLHFLFSKSSPCIGLLERFNEVLKSQIEDGSLDKIIQEYQSAVHDTHSN